MSNNTAKRDNLKIAAVLVGVLILAVGIIGVRAYQSTDQAPKQVIENNYGDITIEGDELLGAPIAGNTVFNEAVLGGQTTTTQSTITPWNDVLYRGCRIAQDDDAPFSGIRNDNVYECYETLRFNSASTTLVTWQNRKGRTIYVTDATAIQLDGIATTTVRIIGGTTTDEWFKEPFQSNNDLINAMASNNIGDVSIIATGDITVGTATNTVWVKEDFQGVDTRDASGERHFVPVGQMEKVILIATSTPQYHVTSTDTLFDGVLHLWYNIYYE